MRRPLIGVAASFLLALLAAGCGDDRGRPNVLLIDLDTFRGDWFGLYEQARGRTPNLDREASRGLYFPNTFAQAPSTLPSQMAIMTSRYPGSHGVGADLETLPDTVQTLAAVMRDGGYQTAAFVDGGYVRDRYGFDAGFEHFDQQAGHLASIVPRALAWLRGRDPTRRFFLWIHAYDPHSPYDPRRPGEAGTRSRRVRERFRGRINPTEVGRILSEPACWSALTDSERVLLHGSYDYAVSCADEWVGELLCGLDSLGVLDNTIVACVSDHGEGLLEHGVLLHSTLHHEILRVPLFIAAPGHGSPSGGDGRIVETIDLAPTVLDLVGLPIPVGFEGRSLTRDGRLRSAEEWGERFAFAQTFAWEGDDVSWSITSPTHQLIRSVAAGERELYAWPSDPEERTNVAAGEAPTVEALEERLREWGERRSASRRVGKPIDQRTLSPRQEEQLRALGYID